MILLNTAVSVGTLVIQNHIKFSRLSISPFYITPTWLTVVGNEVGLKTNKEMKRWGRIILDKDINSENVNKTSEALTTVFSNWWVLAADSTKCQPPLSPRIIGVVSGQLWCVISRGKREPGTWLSTRKREMWWHLGSPERWRTAGLVTASPAWSFLMALMDRLLWLTVHFLMTILGKKGKCFHYSEGSGIRY